MYPAIFQRSYLDLTSAIVTIHQSGLLPTWHICQTSPGLLERIVTRLAPDQIIPYAHILESYDHCQGNIREALREFYDLVGCEQYPRYYRVRSAGILQ